VVTPGYELIFPGGLARGERLTPARLSRVEWLCRGEGDSAHCRRLRLPSLPKTCR